ncbi:uncharacterized protein LOC120112233 [Phoenix dactylifera]|uniref:Uncharacterized protein LOC120112233 n=1 Tax=Phoenix dactylifera TaxID=42345 RepID=A0A8B9AL09_PHODC|nr:uncharacterized protein LOC120112233 [Phoenix dactylifera]
MLLVSPNPSPPSSLNSSLLTNRRRKPLPLTPHALNGDPKPDKVSSSSPSGIRHRQPTFENRLARFRLKYRIGTAKKTEQRRSRKSSGGKKKAMLPPVPLKKEVVARGLAVEVGGWPGWANHGNGTEIGD